MSAGVPSLYSPVAMELAAVAGLQHGRANLEVFADTLLTLAKADPNMVAVTSDSRGSGKLVNFGKALPRQIVEVGIAEQNLVSIAAGLAATGKRVFAVSPACFLTARSLEQIKNDIAYSDYPVCMVGISAGVSYGALGSTHHSLHDFAVMRAINNIAIIAPADNAETIAAVRYAASATQPVYLRFGKAALLQLHQGVDTDAFASGRARTVRAGNDLCFIACGETVIHALLAAELLAVHSGIRCRVISHPFIKPLDREAILAAANQTGAVITVEEHMVNGGLGEACASLILQAGVHCRFQIAGIPDEYTVTGSQADIFRHYGISAEGLAASASRMLDQGSY